MIIKAKADGFSFVKVIPIEDSGVKRDKGMRNQRYRIETYPTDELYSYIRGKINKSEKQTDSQKLRDNVKKLRQKKITTMVSNGQQLVPMRGVGNSELNKGYIPGYDLDEFKRNGVAPPNLSEEDLQIYDNARLEAMEERNKHPSPPSNSNTKVCSFSLYT